MKSSYKLAGACLSAALLAACAGSVPSSTPLSVAPQLVQKRSVSITYGRHRVKKNSETMTYLYSFTGLADGNTPYGPLLSVSGTLYGTSSSGQNGCQCGSIYSIASSGTFAVVHTFGYPPDANTPHAGLINVNGLLYGTTGGGGAYGAGAVYTVPPTPSGTESVLESFYPGSDGQTPVASLIATGSTLYGTTSAGGVYNTGTAFSMTTSGAETVLHSFGGSGDGTNPVAPLLNVGNKLYGTTESGGVNGCGSVFAITKANGHETVLYSFTDRPDGCTPRYGALISLNGTMYGTTSTGGGGSRLGTVYSITPSGTETVLHTFNAAQTAPLRMGASPSSMACSTARPAPAARTVRERSSRSRLRPRARTPSFGPSADSRAAHNRSPTLSPSTARFTAPRRPGARTTWERSSRCFRFETAALKSIKAAQPLQIVSRG